MSADKSIDSLLKEQRVFPPPAAFVGLSHTSSELRPEAAAFPLDGRRAAVYL